MRSNSSRKFCEHSCKYYKIERNPSDTSRLTANNMKIPGLQFGSLFHVEYYQKVCLVLCVTLHSNNNFQYLMRLNRRLVCCGMVQSVRSHKVRSDGR